MHFGCCILHRSSQRNEKKKPLSLSENALPDPIIKIFLYKNAMNGRKLCE